MLNQACIMCSHCSSKVICDICLSDCKSAVKQTPAPDNPVLIDMQQQADVDQLRVLSWYHWPVNELIHFIKFKQRPRFCHLLSQWFVKYGLQGYKLPDALLAMPSGPLKQFIRGYNPALKLSLALSRELDIVDMSSYLSVRSSLIDQHQLSRQKRLNRSKCFAAKKLPPWVKHIAIVDDIITTGSTMGLAVTAVRQCNPELEISAWCMGATLPNSSN